MIDEQLVAKMAELEAAYEQTLVDMADPDVLADPERYTEITKHHAELKAVVEAYRSYQDAAGEAHQNEQHDITH